MAVQRYKDMLVAASLDDVQLTDAITGLDTSILRPSLIAAGLDPKNLPARDSIEISKDINPDAPRRWKDIWSGGHSVEGVRRVQPVADLVREVANQYQQARMQPGR